MVVQSPLVCNQHDVDMCAKYATRHITRTEVSFELAYSLVHERYQFNLTWPVCDDGAFSADEDEARAQEKLNCQDTIEAAAQQKRNC
eukprot:2544007-Prorocentrum_lima.AAC.1